MANFTARLAHAANYFELGIRDTSQNNVSVANTITFNQTVDANNVIVRSLSNTITFAHTLSRAGSVYSPNVSNLLVFNQSPFGDDSTHVGTASNTLVFIQLAARTYERSSLNTISFFQIVATDLTKIAANTLTLSQTLVSNVAWSRSLTSTLHLNHALQRQLFANRTITSTLSISENLSFFTVYTKFIHQYLNLQQRIDDPNKQIFHINQAVSVVVAKSRQASNQLILTQSVQASVVYNRSVSNQIQFRTGYSRQSDIPGLSVNVTHAEGIVVKSLVILETDDTVIVLPAPVLNDKDIFDGGKVEIKKSAVNDLYAYIRRTNKEKLTYVFSLDYPKAMELVYFLKRNFTKPIKMINFKGEIWNVHISNSPFDFVYKMRAMKAPKQVMVNQTTAFGAPIAGSGIGETPIAGEGGTTSSTQVQARDNERIEVTLEFIGERL